MSKCVSYHYVEHKNTNEIAYKINEGKYAGVVWNYSDVKMTIYDEGGNIINPELADELPLTFNYEVMYNPNDEDLKTGEFSATIGDILLDVIDASIEHDQIKFNTTNRNNNPS